MIQMPYHICKRIFNDNFQNNVLLMIPFSLLETRTQSSELTPGTISNHKNYAV